MRPPEFTGGNAVRQAARLADSFCFNEAAGIHRRKQMDPTLVRAEQKIASMRPPEFTGGNFGRQGPRRPDPQ